ncbi:MAG: aldo/keto reductase [Oscillospiraceae bacterium]|nr:aldo/keto reductase [Oscillospiraceae bacterium]
MQTISLSNDRHKIDMTKLAVGHAGCKDLGFLYSYLDEYLDAGGNCIDTARMYDHGLAEEIVGAYMKTKQRDKLVVVTKCAHYDTNFYPIRHRLSESDIRSDVETSLRELDTDYIDVLLLHRDDIKRPVEAIMPILHQFVKDGKVRVIGTSNWTAGRIQAANIFAAKNGLTPFSVSQIHHSLALTTAAQSGDLSHVIMDNIEYAWYKDTKFPIMAWSSTGKGFFSKQATGVALDPRGQRYYGWLRENFRRLDRAKELARKHSVSVGAVVLSYLMSDKTVPTVAVTAFSKQPQFDEALEATKLHLTEAERAFLAGNP